MKQFLKDFLFLFDIDGTILETHGGGKKSLLSSIEEILKVKVDYSESFAGGIDYIFFKNYYKRFNIKEDFNKLWFLFKDKYENNLKNINKEKWGMFPNVYECIEFLSTHSNIALATGNTKEAAYIKLNTFGLDKFFLTGGFGENVETRKEIVSNAIVNSENLFNKKFLKEKIFLFGDTEKDIVSAIENNITPILIDHKEINYDKVEQYDLKYYGKFKDINLFLDKIRDNYLASES